MRITLVLGAYDQIDVLKGRGETSSEAHALPNA
jgi:hypothetical protein